MFSRWRVPDPFSGLSHLGGAVLSAGGLVALLCFSGGRPWHLTGFSVYGATLVLLYLASAAYHLVPAAPDRRRWLLLADHIGIYFLIAGTYTPVCLVNLRGPWGWSLLGAIWGLAALGVALRVAWQQGPEWIGFSLYIVMGWLAVVAVFPLVRALPIAALGWLLAGGLLYTVGAAIFASQRPRLWPGVFSSHELWHVFVLGGSACHFVVMLGFVAAHP